MVQLATLYKMLVDSILSLTYQPTGFGSTVGVYGANAATANPRDNLMSRLAHAVSFPASVTARPQ